MSKQKPQKKINLPLEVLTNSQHKDTQFRSINTFFTADNNNIAPISLTESHHPQNMEIYKNQQPLTSPNIIPSIRPSSITLRPSITQVPSLSSIPSIGPSSSVIPTLSLEPSVSLTPTSTTLAPNFKKDDSKKKSMKDKDKNT